MLQTDEFSLDLVEDELRVDVSLQWRHSGRVMTSQITSLAIVYITVYSGVKKTPKAFVWGITGDWWIPRSKGQ